MMIEENHLNDRARRPRDCRVAQKFSGRRPQGKHLKIHFQTARQRDHCVADDRHPRMQKRRLTETPDQTRGFGVAFLEFARFRASQYVVQAPK